MAGKEVDKMKEKKDSSKEESPIPMLILVAVIILGTISLVVFLIIGK